jgi:hypothetical protein
VKEDVPAGSEVLRVVATDSDEGRNADVRYAIHNATDLSFAIGETTGSLYTTGYAFLRICDHLGSML